MAVGGPPGTTSPGLGGGLGVGIGGQIADQSGNAGLTNQSGGGNWLGFLDGFFNTQGAQQPQGQQLTAVQKAQLGLGALQTGAALTSSPPGSPTPFQGAGPSGGQGDFFTPLLNALMANALSTAVPPGPVRTGFEGVA